MRGLLPDGERERSRLPPLPPLPFSLLSATFSSCSHFAFMSLGAPPFKVFTAITLPIIMPAVASGWLLAFTLSLDDLVISSFVAGPGATTLPMKVFSSVRLGVSPKINALATIVVLFVSVCAAGAGILMFRAERRRKFEIQAAMRDTA